MRVHACMPKCTKLTQASVHAMCSLSTESYLQSSVCFILLLFFETEFYSVDHEKFELTLEK